jgi:hypothetical protein
VKKKKRLLGKDDYELDEQYYNNQDTYQQDDHDHDETARFKMNSAKIMKSGQSMM